MMRKISEESKNMVESLARLDLTSRDIAFFTGISERTIKRNYKRKNTGDLKTKSIRLNDQQKALIVGLHHAGKDFLAISLATKLPPRGVLNFLKNMFEEGWTVKRCPVCGRYTPMKQNRLSMCQECKGQPNP